MKLKSLIVFGSITISQYSYSQNINSRYAAPITPPSNVERYNIDYKLLDESIIASDSSVLNSIDLESIEIHRSNSEQVTIIDPSTGLNIILFHKKRKTNPNSYTNNSDI